MSRSKEHNAYPGARVGLQTQRTRGCQEEEELAIFLKEPIKLVKVMHPLKRRSAEKEADLEEDLMVTGGSEVTLHLLVQSGFAEVQSVLMVLFPFLYAQLGIKDLSANITQKVVATRAHHLEAARECTSCRKPVLSATNKPLQQLHSNLLLYD